MRQYDACAKKGPKSTMRFMACPTYAGLLTSSSVVASSCDMREIDVQPL